MTIGPGKYDDVCTDIRERTDAQGVIVIVLGGNRGNGFSCQTTAAVLADLPSLLEEIAAQIRTDARRPERRRRDQRMPK